MAQLRHSMTPDEYREARKARGTQAEVAALLGISRETLARREAGTERYPITTEAVLAIQALPLRAKAK